MVTPKRLWKCNPHKEESLTLKGYKVQPLYYIMRTATALRILKEVLVLVSSAPLLVSYQTSTFQTTARYVDEGGFIWGDALRQVEMNPVASLGTFNGGIPHNHGCLRLVLGLTLRLNIGEGAPRPSQRRHYLRKTFHQQIMGSILSDSSKPSSHGFSILTRQWNLGHHQ